MAEHERERTWVRRTNVECTDYSVDARSRDHSGTVFVPVMREGFGGRAGSHSHSRLTEHRGCLGSSMDGDLECKVVGGRGRLTQVPDTEQRIGSNTGENVWLSGIEISRIGAAMRGEIADGLRAIRYEDLHSTIPAARAERIFGAHVPVHTEHFTNMILPIRNREGRDLRVKQLDTSIARGHEHLIMVNLRPGQIIQRVLGQESIYATRKG